MKKIKTKELNNIKNLKPINRLIKIIKLLRDPLNGCPWDLKQDFISLSHYPIEEAYELQNAIYNNDINNIKEELGDLFLQVVLFSQIAKDKGKFSLNEVAETISNKLIKRHPQIFDENYSENNFPEETWEKLKNIERNNKNKSYSLIDDIPTNLPSLYKCYKLFSKAKLINFDWENTDEILKKIDEEFNELKYEIKNHDIKKIENELGDLFFTIISLSSFLKLNPEVVLQKSIKKFENRFKYLEKKIYNSKVNIKDKSILEKYWREAKEKEV